MFIDFISDVITIATTTSNEVNYNGVYKSAPEFDLIWDDEEKSFNIKENKKDIFNNIIVY